MILVDTVELDDRTIEFYENGTVQIIRPDRRRISLSAEEASTITNNYNDV